MPCFFFNDTATTEIYTLSLHDALPISLGRRAAHAHAGAVGHEVVRDRVEQVRLAHPGRAVDEERVVGRAGELGDGERSEEHTSELQSRQYLVCRLLLEKRKKNGRAQV